MTFESSGVLSLHLFPGLFVNLCCLPRPTPVKTTSNWIVPLFKSLPVFMSASNCNKVLRMDPTVSVHTLH